MTSIRLFIALLLLCTRLEASDTLLLGNHLYEEKILRGHYLEILEDPSRKIRIGDVLKGKYVFTQNTGNYAYNVRSSSAYWVKFTVKNASPYETHYVLESYAPNTDSLSLYYTDDRGVLHQKETGVFAKALKQEYRHKNLVLDLPLSAAGKSRTFYVRVFSRQHSGFDYRIKSTFLFSSYSNAEYYLLGAYYGMLAILVIYNLIVFLTLKVRLHLYYIFYILSGMLSTLTEDKLGSQFLWPQATDLNNLLNYHVAPLALVLTFVLYSISFLNLKNILPLLYRICLGLTGLYCLLVLLSLVLPLNANVLRFVYVLPYLSILVASWLALRKGYKAARFHLAGVAIVLLSILLIQLRANLFIVPNAFTVYFLNYSLIAESLVLSLALSDRLKLMSRKKILAQRKLLEELETNKQLQSELNRQLQEKNLLQDKVNRELETKVKERTEELQEKMLALEIANSRLEDLTEQANRMNIQLDLDNWSLKKNVQQSLMQRISGEEVSFASFQEVFKNEHSCLRFLDELKWQQGFVCRKCGNTRYKVTDRNFTRKCSKCSYPESVTAHTLLHGLKFSVLHCLYLVYLIHQRKGKIKLEEISGIAGISIPASSRFKARVLANIDLVEKKKNKASSWEELLVISD